MFYCRKFLAFAAVLTMLFTPLVISMWISLIPSQALAQSGDVDEAFDPFSDYNEFEQDVDEEADINFFKNGRYLTLGLQLGYRGFAGGGFSQAYAPNLAYGFQFTYFFDLQLATSLGFSMGDHNVQFQSFSDETLTQVSNTYTGNVNIQTLDLNVKYYFNTENVTKGLADLNPYVIVGVGYYKRTYNLSDQLAPVPDNVAGFKTGLGLEIPLLRRRAYLGIQASYHFVQFPDENKRFIEEGSGGIGTPQQRLVSPRLNGDIFDISTIIGLNF